jgi:hypothetical protein
MESKLSKKQLQKKLAKPHRERKSSLSYQMTGDAYRELLRRCKGSIPAAKMELLRGLSMPQSFKEIVKMDKQNNEIREVILDSSYVDELVEIIVTTI